MLQSTPHTTVVNRHAAPISAFLCVAILGILIHPAYAGEQQSPDGDKATTAKAASTESEVKQTQELSPYGGLGVYLKKTEAGWQIDNVSAAAVNAGSKIQVGDILKSISRKGAESSEVIRESLSLPSLKLLLLGEVENDVEVTVVRNETEISLTLPRVQQSHDQLFFNCVNGIINAESLDLDVVEHAEEILRNVSGRIDEFTARQVFSTLRARCFAGEDADDVIRRVRTVCGLQTHYCIARFGRNSIHAVEAFDLKNYYDFLYQTLDERLRRTVVRIEKKLRAQHITAGRRSQLRSSLLAILPSQAFDSAPLLHCSYDYQRASELYNTQRYEEAEEICLGILAALSNRKFAGAEIRAAAISLIGLSRLAQDDGSNSSYNAIVMLHQMVIDEEIYRNSESPVTRMVGIADLMSARMQCALTRSHTLDFEIDASQSILEALCGHDMSRVTDQTQRANLRRAVSSLCITMAKNGATGASLPKLLRGIEFLTINADENAPDKQLPLARLWSEMAIYFANLQNVEGQLFCLQTAANLLGTDHPVGENLRTRVEANLLRAKYLADGANESILRRSSKLRDALIAGGDAGSHIARQVTRQIGLMNLDLGDYPEAVQEFGSLLFVTLPTDTSHSERSGDMRNLCISLANQGELKTARGLLAEFLRENPPSGEQLWRLSTIQTLLLSIELQFLDGQRNESAKRFANLAEAFLNEAQRRLSQNRELQTREFQAIGDLIFEMPIGLPCNAEYQVVGSVPALHWSLGDADQDVAFVSRVYDALLRYRSILFQEQVSLRRGRNRLKNVTSFNATIVALEKQIKLHPPGSIDWTRCFLELTQTSAARQNLLRPTVSPGLQEDLKSQSLKDLLSADLEGRVFVDFFNTQNPWTHYNVRPNGLEQHQWDTRKNRRIWCCITSGDFHLGFDLCDATEFAAALTEFAGRQRELPFSENHSGRTLSRLLGIDVLLHLCGDASQETEVIFSGALAFNIPFAALPVPGEDNFLIERFKAVSVFPSPADYPNFAERSPRLGQGRCVLLTEGLDGIPGGREEFTEVANLLQKYSSSLGASDAVDSRLSAEQLQTLLDGCTGLIVIGHGESPHDEELSLHTFESTASSRLIPRDVFTAMKGGSTES
jgi:tetratricopeptide (TPR) repeat protein